MRLVVAAALCLLSARAPSSPPSDRGTVNGYLCRHPNDAGRAVRLNLALDAGERDTPELDTVLEAP